MHSLRTSRHLLQLLPQPALPEVSSRSARPLARSASPGASPDTLRPCGLHAASRAGTTGAAEQEGRLQPSVSHQCGNPSRSRSRSATPRCRDRLLQRAAHLESKAGASPAYPLRGSCRRTLRRSHALDQNSLCLLSSRQGAQSRLSRQVCCRSQARLSRRPIAIPWRPDAPGPAKDVLLVDETTIQKRLGGLLKTTVRRPRTCAPISGPLHSSRGHLHPSTRLTGGSKGHFPLAGLRSQQRTEVADPIA